MIDPDAIFTVINRCYPEKSKFNIDLKIVAGVRSNVDQYDRSDWPEITDHYIGLVGEMPLYSSTEQSREREWEHKRRVSVAQSVARFAEALANRNHAYREIGLYLALEARSQARVKQGIANITEQVGYLEKVAGAACAVISPPHVAACVAGATAPDWMEYLAKAGGRHIKHRGPTHIFTHWLIAALAFTFVWDYHGLLTAFAWGGVSHILTDAMTVSGVPFSPYSDRRFHLFGGRFRTGDPIEYAIAALVVIACIGLSHLTGGSGFAPFFYDWGGLYQEGLIDGAEWKANRFRLI